MAPLDRALTSSYRLSSVTIPLTETVWPEITIPVFGVLWKYNQYPHLRQKRQL